MDADKIKELFVLHFEKMIMAGIVGVSGFLIYTGLGLPNFLDEHQPDRLIQNANQVKLAIDEDHNENIIEERKRAPDAPTIVQRTTELYTEVDWARYKYPNPFDGSVSAETILRRQDPLLMPPLDLRAIGVIASIAVKGTREVEDYPVARLEDADPAEVTEQRPTRRRRSNRRNQGMMDDEMMMDSMGEMGGMDEMMMMGMGGMGEDPSMSMAGGSTSGRKLDSKLNIGFSTATGEMGGGSDQKPRPSLGWFIAGTALLPHAEIYQAYEMALKDANEYDPRRDTPLYFDFEVQRADVTTKPADQLADADWSTIYSRLSYAKIADALWYDFAPEIVPEDYRDNNITTWIPPVLLDDYGTFATHPKIPMLSKKELELKALMQADDLEEVKVFGEGEVIDFDNVELSTDTNRTNMGGGMDDYGGDMMGMDDMGMDSMGMGGMAMYGRGGVEVDPVDNKLMRFYDWGAFVRNPAKPGRSYVYRLRYAVIDPNFPVSPKMQPKSSALSPDVASRVSGKMAKAVETGKRDFRLWSEWSAPSPPVSLPRPESIAAGKVSPGNINEWTVNGRVVKVHRESPKAEMVISKYDSALGVRVPVLVKDVKEGSVLTKTAEKADVIDPISLKIKKVENYTVETTNTIIDLSGGEQLAISDDLVSPSRVLMFDSSGKLSVSDDISQQREFRVYSYADERGE